ncbi:MAG: two-component regulator propeller domain-containing protein [Rikenellaceae bacterium]
MKPLKVILVTLLILLIGSVEQGVLANNPITYTQLSTREGLPQSDVNAICEDEKGFIWLATNDGICRYDGYNFCTFPDTDNILETSFILSLCIDRDQNILVGSANKGLAIFNSKEERYSSHLGLSGEPINEIIIDRYGYIYLHIDNNKMYIVTRNGDSLSIARTITEVYSMGLDREGTLYAISPDHITKFKEDLSYDTVNIKSNGELINLKFGQGITTILSHKKLCSINDDNRTTQLLDIEINDYTILVNGDIWISTNDGIYRAYPTKGGYSTPQMVISTGAWCNVMFEDSAGTLWVGTVRRGLHKFTASPNLFAMDNKGRNSEVVYRDSRERLWIGAFTGNIGCYNQYDMSQTYRVNTQSRPYMITSITEHPITNRLYVGDVNGIMSTSTKSDEISLADHKSLKVSDIGNINHLLPDSTYMWIATYNSGLHLYDVLKDEIVHTISVRINSSRGSLLSNIVRSVFKDADGNLWIATSKGLNFIENSERFDAQPHIVSYSSMSSSPVTLSYDYILPIAQRHNGEIVVGTLGGGVNILTPKEGSSNQFENRIFNTESGLSNNTIKAIAVDDNDNIWVSTNQGVNMISGENNSILSYSIEDGLQDYEFCDLSVTKLSNGKIVFGGINGINSFMPDTHINNGDTPTVSFVELQLQNNVIDIGQSIQNRVILNRSIVYTDQITIPFPNKSFAFKFTSINSQLQHAQKYRYKLENFDKSYTYTSAAYRIAKYTNISSGRYRLIVEGSNDGVKWGESACMVINIGGSPFLKWYAILGYLILCAVVVWYIFRTIRNRRMVKSRIAAVNLEKQYIAKLSKAKMDLITNISHEFRTPLTLIISPLQRLLEREGQDESSKRLLQTIDHNSRLLLRFINMFMDYSKSNRDQLEISLKMNDIVSLGRDTLAQFESIAIDKGIHLEFYSSNSQINTLFDQHQMEEVLYNLISNAIKHTARDGFVSLDIDYEYLTTTIRVSDTGQGIADDEQSSIFERFFSLDNNTISSSGIGLNLTKTLVELHGGTINFVSKEGVGTTFVVTLPQQDMQVDEAEAELNGEINVGNNDTDDFIAIDDNALSTQTSILVVDDDPNMVDLLEELLCDRFTVIKAYDGDEALEKSRKFMPDIIISDVRMPRMSGIDLCREIKLDVSTSHIPVILLSSRTSSEVQAGGLNAEADAYCSKPFDNKVLMATIKSLVTNRKRIIDKYKSSYLLSGGEVHSNEEDKLINRAIEIIEENMASPLFSVEFLCKQLDINYITLNKKIKEMTGHTTNIFIRKIKMRRAAQMLQSKKYTVYEVTYAVGFNDLKSFRSNFVKEFNRLPSDFIKQDSDSEITT